MSRVDQINELLHQELAKLISKEVEAPNFMITISYVDCSPDFKSAKIGISVLPEKFSGTALEKLRSHSPQFINNLNKKLKLKSIPRLNWLIDTTEKEAREIEEILDKIKKNKI